jgi:hypothetical protein
VVEAGEGSVEAGSTHDRLEGSLGQLDFAATGFGSIQGGE